MVKCQLGWPSSGVRVIYGVRVGILTQYEWLMGAGQVTLSSCHRVPSMQPKLWSPIPSLYRAAILPVSSQ